MKIQIPRNRIREVREDLGITSVELAAAIGRNVSQVSRYENGFIDIPLSVFVRIADYLDVEVGELLDYEEE